MSPTTPKQICTHLQSLRHTPVAAVTRDTLTATLDAVYASTPLADTLKDPRLTGWTGTTLTDALTDYGAYVGKRHDNITSIVRYVPGVLLWPPTNSELRQAYVTLTATRVSKRRRDHAAHLWGSTNVGDVRYVSIGAGWEPYDEAKALSAATAAILYSPDPSGDLDTYLENAPQRCAASLVSPVYVHTLTWLSTTGLWPALATLTSDHVTLADGLYTAWTWMARMSARAHIAWTFLCSQQARDALSDTGWQLVDAATQYRWVAPYETDRLITALNATRAHPDNERLKAAAHARLHGFTQWAPAPPADPTEFTFSHARLLCSSHGLQVDIGRVAPIRRDLGNHLRDHGLPARTEADYRDGLAAWYAGLYDTYKTVTSKQAAGDPAWEREWTTAVTAAFA